MNLLNLGVTILDPVINFFETLGKNIGGDNLILVGLLVMLLIVGAGTLRIMLSYEVRLARSTNLIINYLIDHPHITSENLVEFNRLMKRVPVKLRYQWQKYMLNRDKKPSDFINTLNCVDRPAKVSSLANISFATKTATFISALLIFLLYLGAAGDSSISFLSINTYFLTTLVVPGIMIFIGTLFLVILKAKVNDSTNTLLVNFDALERTLDRAVIDMPAFVDYEILFTKKEILNGIPALQEYLEQRALYEEEMLIKAKESAVEHEEYDFTSVGLDGSIVLERSIKESEYYLGNRKRLLLEIENINIEKEKLEKNHEDEIKVSQRKLRDIRDELERLKDKLATVNNKIIANDLRKQQADETRKQQILENEVIEFTKKYEEDLAKFIKEIDERKEEIEKGKLYLQTSIIGEFNSYNTKTMKVLQKKVDDEFADTKKSLNEKMESMSLSLSE